MTLLLNNDTLCHAMRSCLLLLLLPLLFNSAQAQINPPELLCVKNDTLFWETPVNTCGAFQQYTIFVSDNIAGPYEVLTAITNPNTTSFFHANAGTNIRHYYMVTEADCPGQTQLSSDTLDNRIPLAGLIRYVSVRGNDVEIGWEASTSPEVFAYIISKNTPAGTTIIDTVFNGTTYLDTNANPAEAPETYFVVAIDRCGNNSLIPPPHSTMLLEGMGASACDRTVQLNWGQYRNWANPIAKYEILVSENGSAPRLVGETGGNTTNFTFQNAGADVEYCFVVRAVEAVTGNIASSNEVCLTLDVIPGITELIVTNATVLPDNTVRMTWVWNPNAALRRVEVQRAAAGGAFANVQAETPAMPLRRENTFDSASANPGQGPVSYRIRTTDECDANVISNAVATIFLQAQSQGLTGENLLRWTDYENEYASDFRYELYRQTSGATPVLIAEYPPGMNEHTDLVDVNDPIQASACYFVLTKATLTFADGQTASVESRSNVACTAQEAELFIPNAFVPGGVNRIFRPVLQFGQPASYRMVIYDRWGGKLFESQNIETGWNGRSDSRELPQGAYTYHIRLTQVNGKVIERAGLVMLIR